MEQLVYGLIIAAIGAITYVAYQHPDAYKHRIFPVLAVAGIAIYVSICVWDAALSTVGMALDRAFALGLSVKIDKVLDEKHVPFISFFLIWAASWVYLSLLLKLDVLLGKNGPK